MKEFLLALFPNLTAKAAITAAVCVTAGAAVTATATGVVYKQKVAAYESTIDQLEAKNGEIAEASRGSGASGSGGAAAATAVRVVDGILEVWDGSEWVSYGSVDDVTSGDPYYENDEKRQETENSVAAKKLA
ncbi:MAG: hypothetical protein K6F87_01035, partial [Lachnospiraceae bacterium]|nr:hypothetical protein [Lachnospiraceae bacterium]